MAIEAGAPSGSGCPIQVQADSATQRENSGTLVLADVPVLVGVSLETGLTAACFECSSDGSA